MKWSIVGLMMLGVVAAGCAALLVASLRGESLLAKKQSGTDEEVRVVVVTKDLPAMSIIDEQVLEIREVSATGLPAGHYEHTAGLIGRRLIDSVKKEQILTLKNIAPESPIYIPEGMCAFSMLLPWSNVIVMAPGSIVNVLVSYKIASGTRRRRQEAVAKILLNSVRIVAIDGKTVGVDDKEETKSRAKRFVKNRVVTLLLSLKQATQLQRAKKEGTVTLALINPIPVQSGSVNQTPPSEFAKKLPVTRDDWVVTLYRGREKEELFFPWPFNVQQPGSTASKDRAQQKKSPSAAATLLVKKASQMEGTEK